jgi:hypothetical protein
MHTSGMTDITSSVPKVIDPSTHAVLDYLKAGAFIAMGFGLLNRKSQRGEPGILQWRRRRGRGH